MKSSMEGILVVHVREEVKYSTPDHTGQAAVDRFVETHRGCP